MKYIFLMAITAACFLEQAFAQLSFEQNGTVKFTDKPPFLIKKDSIPYYKIDSVKLETWQAAQLMKFKEDIKASLKASMETLSDPSDSLPLIKWLIGPDSLRILNEELQKIYDSIEPGTTGAAVASTSILHPFAEALQQALASRLFRVSMNNSIPHYQEYQLIQYDLPTQFLTRYYNSILARPGNQAVPKLTMTDYYRFYEMLKPLYDRVSGLLQQVYKQADPETLEQLYLSHQSFNTDYKNNSPFVKLLKQPFFRQWIWSTGGVIKLQPIDFTAARLMDTVPELDLLTHTFTKKEFIVRNNRLLEENKPNIQKLLHPAQAANRIRFPIGDPGSNQYFLLDAKKKELEMEKITPLDKGEKIYLLLLNIDKGYSARYKTTSTKQLSGKSPTEEMIDTATGTVLRLFSLINPQLGRIVSVLNRINPNNRREDDLFTDNITSGHALLSFKMATPVVPKEPDFWDDLQKDLKATVEQIMDGQTSDLSFYKWPPIQIDFNDSLFVTVKHRFNREVVDTLKSRSVKKLEHLRKKIASNYLSKMYTYLIAPIIIDTLRQDSLYMAQLINVLSFSSLPVAKMDVLPDTIPRFQTALLVIDDKAQNIEQGVVVDRINETKKDSVALVSFSYKKGRHSLVEVSF